MSYHLADLLLEVIVHLIDRLGLLILRCGDNPAFLKSNLPNIHAMLRIVGDFLCDDVLRSRQGILQRRYLLLLRDIGFRLFFYICGSLLCQNQHRQAFQSFFLRNRRPCPPLRAIGTIQIIHYYLGLRRKNLLFQILRKFSLFLDASQHLLFLFLKIPKIGETLAQVAKLFIIQRAVGLLPISGDKGNRISLVNQLHSSLHLPWLYR